MEHLQGEIVYLREQLAGTIDQLAKERERERFDIIHRTALDRIEALASSTNEAVESPESDETDDQAREHQHDETYTPAGMWARLRRWITRE